MQRSSTGTASGEEAHPVSSADRRIAASRGAWPGHDSRIGCIAALSGAQDTHIVPPRVACAVIADFVAEFPEQGATVALHHIEGDAHGVDLNHHRGAVLLQGDIETQQAV
mgnify:CR=1 FL=1